MSEQDWLWLGTAGFGLGFLVLLAFGWNRRTRDEESHWLIHLFVVLTAFTSYLVMASGGGRLLLADGRVLFVARYIDWSITTPLLLLGLSLTALHTPFRRWALVLGLMATDAYMIVTGLFADAAPAGSALKWTWYLVSSGAFVFIYLCLWGAMRREAETSGKLAAAVYRRNLTFLSLVWLAYPLVFLFGTEGLRSLGEGTETALYTLLDLTAKVAFGLFSLANTRRRVSEELRAGLVPEHDLRPSRQAFHEQWAPGTGRSDEDRR
ncbi:bacteriorhodopsin [Sphingomonas sp. BN140010]|uniref:Bacteriorhodopsin n=1 Tax=Sphingomonas arvum TaxID=2992113 RepID=A0ABT3JDE1_9SPHN|nr:bacteriorhodopsin [Sphingomonas sp. BN140010]MCW3797100.1 bacteriorhodopsin [Sphingomonas sp. BN140010]